MSIYGYRKEFGEKLAKLMPAPKPKANTTTTSMAYEIDHMRQAADSFSYVFDGDVPRSTEEFRDALYVFGKLTHEMLEKQISMHEEMNRLAASAGLTFAMKEVS
jgi:hypothetical protein